MMLVEVPPNDLQVATVRAEEEVGNGADPGNEPEQEIDADIAGHAAHLPLGHAEVARFPDEVAAERSAGDVPYARDEIQDHIETDRTIDAGDDEHPFQQFLHHFDAVAN